MSNDTVYSRVISIGQNIDRQIDELSRELTAVGKSEKLDTESNHINRISQLFLNKSEEMMIQSSSQHYVNALPESEFGTRGKPFYYLYNPEGSTIGAINLSKNRSIDLFEKSSETSIYSIDSNFQTEDYSPNISESFIKYVSIYSIEDDVSCTEGKSILDISNTKDFPIEISKTEKASNKKDESFVHYEGYLSEESKSMKENVEENVATNNQNKSEKIKTITTDEKKKLKNSKIKATVSFPSRNKKHKSDYSKNLNRKLSKKEKSSNELYSKQEDYEKQFPKSSNARTFTTKRKESTQTTQESKSARAKTKLANALLTVKEIYDDPAFLQYQKNEGFRQNDVDKQENIQIGKSKTTNFYFKDYSKGYDENMKNKKHNKIDKVKQAMEYSLSKNFKSDLEIKKANSVFGKRRSAKSRDGVQSCLVQRSSHHRKSEKGEINQITEKDTDSKLTDSNTERVDQVKKVKDPERAIGSTPNRNCSKDKVKRFKLNIAEKCDLPDLCYKGSKFVPTCIQEQCYDVYCESEADHNALQGLETIIQQIGGLDPKEGMDALRESLSNRGILKKNSLEVKVLENKDLWRHDVLDLNQIFRLRTTMPGAPYYTIKTAMEEQKQTLIELEKEKEAMTKKTFLPFPIDIEIKPCCSPSHCKLKLESNKKLNSRKKIPCEC